MMQRLKTFLFYALIAVCFSAGLVSCVFDWVPK